jgi:tRNA dimethylallyltransferase
VSERQHFDAIAICGPTSSGKSEIAVRAAEAIGGEIVNADSRQVYRGMSIGTGAPDEAMRKRVPHHLFGFVDPCVRYSAGAYVVDAVAAIQAIAARGRVPIVVGGTGLYVEALGGSMPMDRPVADDAIRERVRREAAAHPHEYLYGWLAVIAPDVAKRVELRDRYRTLRALESVLMVRSGNASPHHGIAGTQRHVAMRVALLVVEDDALHARIAARVRAMYEEGLVDEAVAIWRRCPDSPALTGLGYAEALAWFRGESLRAEAVDATIARTLRYAKRQRTWFRRIRDGVDVDASDPTAAAAAIERMARESGRST